MKLLGLFNAVPLDLLATDTRSQNYAQSRSRRPAHPALEQPRKNCLTSGLYWNFGSILKIYLFADFPIPRFVLKSQNYFLVRAVLPGLRGIFLTWDGAASSTLDVNFLSLRVGEVTISFLVGSPELILPSPRHLLKTPEHQDHRFRAGESSWSLLSSLHLFTSTVCTKILLLRPTHPVSCPWWVMAPHLLNCLSRDVQADSSAVRKTPSGFPCDQTWGTPPGVFSQHEAADEKDSFPVTQKKTRNLGLS